MQRLVVCLVLSLCLCGCWLIEKQAVQLAPETVAAVEADLGGPAKDATLAALRAAIEKVLGVQVSGVVVTDAGVEVTLPEPGLEMAEAAGSTLAEKILENPTPYGIGIGALAALAAALGVYRKRSKLRTGTKPTPPEAGGAK